MPTVNDVKMRKTWDRSFAAQIAAQAYNTAAVESVIRNVAYYLRSKGPGAARGMHFLEMGCGAGPNLLWLAEKGVKVSGVDISPTALALARKTLRGRRVGKLVEASVAATPFPDASFDGIIESCVFQHLDKETREASFAEVRRLLKPGGVFVGHMLDRGHTVYRQKKGKAVAGDPGTLRLEDGSSNFHLTNIGLSHFFSKAEYPALLPGFRTVDPCLTTYEIPKDEAKRRGYAAYKQSMWIVYAVK